MTNAEVASLMATGGYARARRPAGSIRIRMTVSGQGAPGRGKSWVLAMLAPKRGLRVAPVPPQAADLTQPGSAVTTMPGRDEGTGALIEPRNTPRSSHRLAVAVIRCLQSLAQWWGRLNTPHTQKFG